MKLLAGPVLAICMAGAAHAQDNVRPYVGLNYEVVGLSDFDTDGMDDFLIPDSTESISVRAGVHLTEWLSVEAEYGQGLDNNADDGVAGYDNRFGGFARARYAFDREDKRRGGEIFARAGYANSRFDSQTTGGEVSLDGFAFGVGFGYAFGAEGNVIARLDITRYGFGDADNLLTGDSLNSNVYGIGLGYQF